MPSQSVTSIRQEPWPETVDLRGRTVRSRAPLRIGLAGGGSDVSPYCDRFGGLVLNATIDRYCYGTISERDDGSLVLHAADLGLSDVAVDRASDVLPLHAAVYRRICDQFGLGRPGLTITTVADAPPGSGLGSSSTLVVSLVEAFRELFSLPLDEHDVARLAFEIERVDCGLAGGRQDQYAATFGGFNVMEFADGERVVVNPLRLKAAVVQEFEASLVLFHTGASRSSARIIAEQTAHVENLDQGRIEATHQLKVEAVAMKEALLVGDFDGMATIMQRGWEAKKRLADGISNDVIDEVFDAALGAGARAGKVSGAGGGGHIMFLVDPTDRPKIVRTLSQLPQGSVERIHFVSDGASAWAVR